MKCTTCEEEKRNYVCFGCINTTLRTKKNFIKDFSDETEKLTQAYTDMTHVSDRSKGPASRTCFSLAPYRIRVEQLEHSSHELRQFLENERTRLTHLQERWQTKLKRLEVIPDLISNIPQDLDQVLISTELMLQQSSALQKERETYHSTQLERIDQYNAVSQQVVAHRRRAIQTLVSLFRLRKVRRTLQGTGMDGIDSSIKRDILLPTTDSLDDIDDGGFIPIENETMPSHPESESTTNSSLSSSYRTTTTITTTVPQISFQYRMHLVPCPSQNKFPLKSSARKRIQAALGYAVQFTILISQYLNVTLPFRLAWNLYGPCVYEGVETSAKFRRLVPSDADVDLDSQHGQPEQHQQYSSYHHQDDFVYALAMLNYDIMYLCFSQGTQLPEEKCLFSFENLARCCEADRIGRDFLIADLLILKEETKNVEPRVFHMDFEGVLDVHRKWAASGKSGQECVADLLAKRQREHEQRQERGGDDDEWMFVEDSSC